MGLSASSCSSLRLSPIRFKVRKVDREIAVQRMGLMKELRIRIVGFQNRVGRICDDRATLRERLDTAFNARLLRGRPIER